MNGKKNMVIIKGEIKTSDVQYCRYYAETKKTDVRFNNGKVYSYAYENVEWLKEPRVLNPNMYRISREGHVFNNIDAIYVFSGEKDNYWHICFFDGSERDYSQRELNIVKSCLDQSQVENVFAYLKQISSLSNVKNEETGEKILPKKYEKISFVGEDVALAKYLNPSPSFKNRVKGEYIPIFPFGCNNSQYRAVKSAMENQISVIQGPPGTGKTQTILNIIANIVMQGKTVQIVSNNNSATENVYEKLASSKYNLGFIAAMLGKSENKKAFILQQDANYPDFSSWRVNDDLVLLQRDVKEKSIKLKDTFDKQEELANLKQEQAQLLTELEYFNQYVQTLDVNVDSINVKRQLNAKRWMELWQECQMFSEANKKIGFIFKLKGFFRYGIFNLGFYKQDIGKIITTFQAMYYRAKQVEISENISNIEKYLKNQAISLLDDLCNQSMAILKDNLARKYDGRGNRPIFDEDDLWKYPQNVLKEYPVVLSTTFSSRSSLNSNVVYDYLIMDEASQVDIATGALALSCARNVVIVGDTKQLPNVVKGEDKERAKAIFDSFNIREGYLYTKSFLQSILEILPDVKQTMLREHYRCHPKIINFCNQKFYGGELLIMTEDKGEEDVLVAVKTVKGNHVRDHYSQRQIDVIKNEIIPNYVIDIQETGIIAPYKNQVEALAKEFKTVNTATVHSFQGKEKDTIIISTVDDEITDFVDDPYLLNVAVSRAKKKLMVVVTGNEQKQERNITDLIAYIQYNNFEVTDSKVYSIFDYLYKQYAEERKVYLQKHKRISEFDSENLMQALIEEVLSMDKYACLNVVNHFPMRMLIKNTELLNERESRYAMHSATHIDFLIYNRISKKPVLAIEVDGYEYHKSDTEQALRDEMKKQILKLYGIRLKRFKTNGSGEKDLLVQLLDEVVG